MKGKHSVSAAARHAIQDRDGEITTYQKRVKDLTAEVKRLRDAATARSSAHSVEVKRLKAERDEGLSPMVRVIQNENASLKERLDRAQREVRDINARRTREFENTRAHFIEAHQMTPLEATEAAITICAPDLAGRVLDVDDLGSLVSDPGAVRILQRARGQRR